MKETNILNYKSVYGLQSQIDSIRVGDPDTWELFL